MYVLDASEIRRESSALTIVRMAKNEERSYTDPITVRFDIETFEKLSQIRFAVMNLTGARMPMNALVTAAVKEYIANHADLIAKPRPKK